MPAEPAGARADASRRCATLLELVALAVLLTAPFRLGAIPAPAWAPGGVPVLAGLLESAGVLAAALWLTRCGRRWRRPVTLLGARPAVPLAMAAVAVLAFALVGANGPGAWTGGVLGITVLIYCAMEESGWRGALHNLLAPWPAFARSLAVGTAWYVWHLSFLAPDASWARELGLLACLVLASLALDRLAARTGAVLVVALFHLLVNVLAFNALAAALGWPQRLGIVALCLAGWWPLLRAPRPRAGPAL
ncbi:CPBP family glutamic-type intramembrane protease [Luteimonas cellulosilyticus]|uniref:CPBP family glutamic-type intramembrane protease n=1 Tax=Luteimonas cellulosilyticus TaxID=2683586 RepID=UPI00135980DE|nr:CPBP family glutamic-type intramembrane protease [Luteimonas cellulosilyticus]